MRIFKDNVSKIKDRNKLKVVFIQKTWEEFSSSADASFDLITFFHSVYGIGVSNGIFPSLKNLTNFLKSQGRACVVVESPNSDLQLIKREVWPELYEREPISSETVERTLAAFDISYAVDTDEPEQRFYVDELLDPNNPRRMEPLSFIAQTQPENYNRLVPVDIQVQIEKSVREKMKADKRGSYISTPDRFIWTRK